MFILEQIRNKYKICFEQNFLSYRSKANRAMAKDKNLR